MRLEEISRIMMPRISACSIKKRRSIDMMLRNAFSAQEGAAFDLSEEIRLQPICDRDGYEICGGGIIRQNLEDSQSW